MITLNSSVLYGSTVVDKDIQPVTDQFVVTDTGSDHDIHPLYSLT